MTTNIIRYFIMFILLVLTQVLLLNNIQYSGYINPFIYIYFIITLPFSAPRWSVVILGFLIGICIDAFSDTAGVHAAAGTFLGYIRFHVLNLLKPREGYESSRKPSVKEMGFSWYLVYVALMILLHHTLYFFVEVFRLTEVWLILSRVLLSGVFTWLLVMLVHLLFSKQRDGE